MILPVIVPVLSKQQILTLPALNIFSGLIPKTSLYFNLIRERIRHIFKKIGNAGGIIQIITSQVLNKISFVGNSFIIINGKTIKNNPTVITE